MEEFWVGIILEIASVVVPVVVVAVVILDWWL